MENNRGSALISAVVAIIVILIVITGAMTVSSGFHQRAIAAEHKSQAFYTARSTINLFTDIITSRDDDDIPASLADFNDTVKEKMEAYDYSAAGTVFKTRIDYNAAMGWCDTELTYFKEDTDDCYKLTVTAHKNEQQYTMSVIYKTSVIESPNLEIEVDLLQEIFGISNVITNAGGNVNLTTFNAMDEFIYTAFVVDPDNPGSSVASLSNPNHRVGVKENYVFILGDGGVFAMGTTPSGGTSGLTPNNPQITGSDSPPKRIYFIMGKNSFLSLDTANYGDKSHHGNIDLYIILLPGVLETDCTIILNNPSSKTGNNMNFMGVYSIEPMYDDFTGALIVPDRYTFPEDFIVRRDFEGTGAPKNLPIEDPFANIFSILNSMTGEGGGVSGQFINPEIHIKGD